MRDAELLEPVRQREARLLLGVPRQRAEGAQPVEAVPPRREREEAPAAPAKPAWPTGRRLARASHRPQQEEDERDPLDQDGERPGGPAQAPAAAARTIAPSVSAIGIESLCPPPAKWIGKERVPANERRRVRAVARETGGQQRQASTPAAASTLKIHAAAPAEEPETSATTRRGA